MSNEISVDVIITKIWEIRGKKVMLDSDLAKLYGVQTKVLVQAVKRNIRRFPADFMYQLTKKEIDSLRSQFVTSKRGGTRKLPLLQKKKSCRLVFVTKRKFGCTYLNLALK